MKRLFYLILIFVVGNSSAFAWDTPNRPVLQLEQVVSEMKVRNVPLFYSQCFLGDHAKAVLVFDNDTTEGDFYILSDNVLKEYGAIITASATVTIRNGVISVVKAQNLSENSQKEFAQFLVHAPYYILMPDQIDTLYREAAPHSC